MTSISLSYGVHVGRRISDADRFCCAQLPLTPPIANTGLQEQSEAATTAQGYLLKQGVKGIRKAFRKRWFDLKNGILYYYVSTSSRAHKGFIDLKNCKFVVSYLRSVGFAVLIVV